MRCHSYIYSDSINIFEIHIRCNGIVTYMNFKFERLDQIFRELIHLRKNMSHYIFLVQNFCDVHFSLIIYQIY